MTASRYTVREVRCDFGWDTDADPQACFESVEWVGRVDIRTLRAKARKEG